MRLRDRIEAVLRRRDRYETSRGAPPIIDYDCHPTGQPPTPATRLAVHAELQELRSEAEDQQEPHLDHMERRAG